MNASVQSVVVEIVAHDVARSLDFYRLLGLTVPDPEGPHVEVELPGGNKLAFDTEEVIGGMHPGWTPPTGPGRVAIAFGMSAPAEVDAVFERLTAAGHLGTLCLSTRRGASAMRRSRIPMAPRWTCSPR